MKILLVTLGTDGDVHPFIGMGLALRKRGHDVILLANEHYADRVTAALDFVPLGSMDLHKRIIDDPAFWDPRQLSSVVAEWGLAQMPAQFQAIEANYEPGRTVVVSPASVFGARIAQERLGVPLATVVLQPALFRSAYRPAVMPGIPAIPQWFPRFVKGAVLKGVDAVVNRILVTRVSSYRRELGLEPLTGFVDWWMSPQRIIALFPDWFGDPQPDWPSQTRLTQFPMYDHRGVSDLSSETRDFLDAGDPPIVFTPGTGVGHGHAFFQGAVDACQRMGRRGILLTPYREQLPTDRPDSVRHFDYVPFGQLLPHVAAIVHHGGVGTVSHAMAAGIPQLITPSSYDQPDNARRVKDLGVGDWLKPKSFHGPAIAAKLDRLLTTPHVQSRCQTMARQLRDQDAMGDACDLIEELQETAPLACSSN